jgi:membrane fusion protein (multidrug efflux system)
MNRVSPLLKLLPFAVWVLLFSCSKKEEKAAGAPSGGAQTPPPPAAVDYYVARPTESGVGGFSATGSLLPNESVSIHPERTGLLKELNIAEGGSVRQGWILASLDDSELQAQLTKLKVQQDYLKKEIQRSSSLLSVGGVTAEELDRLNNQLAQTEADIKLLDIQIDKTKVRAPFSGRLGLRQISTGAYVTPATEIVTLQQTDPIKLEFDVPESFSRKVTIGQRLQFTVEGIDRSFEAKVYATAPGVTAATRSLTIRARCANPGNILRPGNFAKVQLFGQGKRSFIAIPTDAVLPVLDGQQVLLIKSGKVEPRKVRTGERTDQTVEITDGLAVGDTVLVSGLLTLRPGMPVNAGKLVELSKAGAK